MSPHSPATAANEGRKSAPRNLGADARVRFAFLAETSRFLADSLDFETTLATGAGLALPHFGTWCMVDIVEEDDSIRRVAVIHPDPEKQRLAREFYDRHPPGRDDPLGAPRVIRTQESEFVLAYDDVLNDIVLEDHRKLLHELGARSFLMVPMSARGRTLGAITFVSDERREYDAADLLLAEDLGRRCAMAVDNARLYAASQQAHRAAEAARVAATVIARRTEELLGEANVARHDAEEADRAKTHFLGTISHELRTPLTAMQGFTTLLSDEVGGCLNEGQQHQVGRIRAASDHLLTLIEEILGFARQNAGRAELRLQDVDLGDVVRDAASMVESLAADKGLEFRLGIPQQPMPVQTDPGKLRQIILNLVANAVKFTDSGEVRLDAEPAGDFVVLRVSDTGIGIAPEHLDQVFTAFWQVDQSSRRVGGIGLGLAVTRQLAELLGGEVTLESTPEEGSIFTVRLPLVVPVPERSEPDPETGVMPGERRVSGRRGLPRRKTERMPPSGERRD